MSPSLCALGLLWAAASSSASATARTLQVPHAGWSAAEMPRVDGEVGGGVVVPSTPTGRWRLRRPGEWLGAAAWNLSFRRATPSSARRSRRAPPPEEGLLLSAWSEAGLHLAVVFAAGASSGASVVLTFLDRAEGPAGADGRLSDYTLRVWMGNRPAEEGGFDGSDWVSNRQAFELFGRRGPRPPRASLGRAALRGHRSATAQDPQSALATPRTELRYQFEAFLPADPDPRAAGSAGARRVWSRPPAVAAAAATGRRLPLSVAFDPGDGELYRLSPPGHDAPLELALEPSFDAAAREVSCPLSWAIPQVDGVVEADPGWKEEQHAVRPLSLVSASGEAIEATLLSCDDGWGNYNRRLSVFGNGHLYFALLLDGVSQRPGDQAELAMESGRRLDGTSGSDALLSPGAEIRIRVQGDGSPSGSFAHEVATRSGWRRAPAGEAAGAVRHAARGYRFEWRVPYGYHSPNGLSIYDRQEARLALRFVRADGEAFVPDGAGDPDGFLLVPGAPRAALGWLRVFTQAPRVAFRHPRTGAPLSRATDVIVRGQALGTTGPASAGNEVRSVRVRAWPEGVSASARFLREAPARRVAGDLWAARLSLPESGPARICLQAIATDANGNRNAVRRSIEVGPAPAPASGSLSFPSEPVSFPLTGIVALRAALSGIPAASVERAWLHAHGADPVPAHVVVDRGAAALVANLDTAGLGAGAHVLVASVELRDGHRIESAPWVASVAD